MWCTDMILHLRQHDRPSPESAGQIYNFGYDRASAGGPQSLRSLEGTLRQSADYRRSIYL